ncbi:arylsulfatase I [Neoarius graeffei]|uniref:arylsulfatase I n=1 Tax=Neoarius graeffei TaxID=443677 RepID=UPI00298CA365|nr:arylsulfatase I [Neoarius graeffei]
MLSLCVLCVVLDLGGAMWDWMKPNQVESNSDRFGGVFKPRPPPHIIFILTDDQGFNDIGYHSAELHTPTLDKLAADGVRLENYYVQPLCTPSRSQLITGRYQIHTGLQHSIIRPRQPNCIPLNVSTLPQRLQEVGYSTHMVGKWHLGFYRKRCLPMHRGFHTFFGSLTGSVDYYTFDSCDGKSLCGFDLHDGDSVAWSKAGKYSTHLYTQRVRKILATHDPSQPIFIFLSLQAAHAPLKPPKSYIYPYRTMGNVPRRKYAATISIVDEAVHNITYALRKYGYYRNSVIIFSSDNGAQPFTGGSNWPLRGRKGTYWEGGVRALGFVHSPLIRYKRRISKALIHITDWFPTLVRLAGGNISQNEKLDGYDIWSVISENKASPRFEILHNIDPLHRRGLGSLQKGKGLWDTAVQAAIRVGDWKLLTGDPGHSDWIPPQLLTSFPTGWWNLERGNVDKEKKSIWLFNITADPCERNDLAENRPEVVKKLLQRLAFYNSTATAVRYPPDDPRADPQNNGGAWRPWVKDEEDEENWEGIYYKRGKNRKRKKCKLCNIQSFFKKLNKKILASRI